MSFEAQYPGHCHACDEHHAIGNRIADAVCGMQDNE